MESSILESKIQIIWNTPDVEKAKEITIEIIQSSVIRSTDRVRIIQKVSTIQKKSNLDTYLANCLLKFEGLGIS